MTDYDQLTDDGVLEQLGERLSRYRLDRNLTQAEVATEAGVHKNTVFRLEAGGSTQTKNLVRVLRSLGLLERLDAIVPEPVASPLKQLEAAERQRKRAVSKPQRKADESLPGWTWGEGGDDQDGDGARS